MATAAHLDDDDLRAVGSMIRAAIGSPQVLPAAGGHYQPGSGQASPTPPSANYPQRNYQPQGYVPPPPPSVSPGLQLRSGFRRVGSGRSANRSLG